MHLARDDTASVTQLLPGTSGLTPSIPGIKSRMFWRASLSPPVLLAEKMLSQPGRLGGSLCSSFDESARNGESLLCAGSAQGSVTCSGFPSTLALTALEIFV